MILNSLTKKEQQEITEILSNFGLKEREMNIYLFLLHSGRQTITPVARALNFPVTTVQSILSRLEKIGLLSVTANRSRHIYEAKDPLVLKKILEEKIREVGNAIPILNKLMSEEKISSRARIYRGERATEIFNEALAAKDKMVYEIVSARDFQQVIGEKFHFTRRRKEAGVRLKSLRVEKYEIKKYNKRIHESELREAKFLPREMTFRSSLMFWDDKVAFFTTREEGLSVVIESAVIREMVGQIFAVLWEISRRMETLVE